MLLLCKMVGHILDGYHQLMTRHENKALQDVKPDAN